MFINELILIAYMLCIILGGSSITIAFLGRNRGKRDFNKAIMLFAVGMLIICL
ncbi:MAG: hypothetical protein Q4B18_06850 [Bacillota bacterium]|nr:hypothetical protein [Bacillota bacterium]